jgi:predicted trehalose synthase
MEEIMKVNVRLKCEGPITVEVPDGAENLEDIATQIGEFLESEARIGEFVEFVHADVEAADAGDDVEITASVNEFGDWEWRMADEYSRTSVSWRQPVEVAEPQTGK